MAVAAVLGFDSDDSVADWEGFEADDLPLAAYLDRNDQCCPIQPAASQITALYDAGYFYK